MPAVYFIPDKVLRGFVFLTVERHVRMKLRLA